ncbi:hypothetical protein N7495_003276 [Penicillium taxi]|uniref:uncharacterized protein n=1 Tax=Penicillium taxi TaxID=168475 RepID=UPI002544FC0C|nr:uncharacterized protein N7495_003276 [Penicillium taxi]KAJ5902748.1 hypothetical protein N7495_003276 [Penicillium taxi]
MKRTFNFQFNNWPKIHQPLPRTPRESQQLLNALTSSFRRQLDHAYPASHPSTQDGEPHALNTDSSVHATDQHMHNILDNPLFRIVPPKTISQDHHNPRSLEESKRLAENPMVVFDELAASGSVTLWSIIQCLKSQLLLAGHPGGNGVNDAMKASRAASRVADWFWASDSTSRLMLLKSRTATSALTKFMVTEGLQITIMNWLNMIQTRDIGGTNGRITDRFAQKTFSHLLLSFMEAEIQYGGGLNTALKYYVRACNTHYNLKVGVKGDKSMFLSAGAHLSRVASDLKPSAEQVSANIYDDYINAISGMTSHESLLFACVLQSHPTHPDPKPFIQLAERLSPQKVRPWTEGKRDAFLRIGSDALRLLIDRKKLQEASNLALRMQTLLPETAVQTADEESSDVASREEEQFFNRLDLTKITRQNAANTLKPRISETQVLKRRNFHSSLPTPEKLLARPDFYRERLFQCTYRTPKAKTEDALLLSIYLFYKRLVLNDNIGLRNEIEYLWYVKWPVCFILDLQDLSKSRYAVLSAIPVLLVESFNQRIQLGLPRKADAVISREELAQYQEDKIFESVPGWTYRVARLEETLVIPHENDEFLGSLEDERSSPQLAAKNILY